MRSFKQICFVVCTGLALSACSCKEWGYCPELFPNAERLTDNGSSK